MFMIHLYSNGLLNMLLGLQNFNATRYDNINCKYSIKETTAKK